MNLSGSVSKEKSLRKSHNERSNEGSTEMMLETIHEVVSVKERSKSKFDQLLKAALEDTKSSKNVPKKKKKSRNTIVDNNDDSANQDLQQESEFNDSDLSKLHKKNKQKADKEGLINVGFEGGSQLETKPQKKNYTLPAIFSKSSGKSEFIRKPSPDIIELVDTVKLVPSLDKTTKDVDVKSKNLINAARPELVEDDERVAVPKQRGKAKKEGKAQ